MSKWVHTQELKCPSFSFSSINKKYLESLIWLITRCLKTKPKLWQWQLKLDMFILDIVHGKSLAFFKRSHLEMFLNIGVPEERQNPWKILVKQFTFCEVPGLQPSILLITCFLKSENTILQYTSQWLLLTHVIDDRKSKSKKFRWIKKLSIVTSK